MFRMLNKSLALRFKHKWSRIRISYVIQQSLVGSVVIDAGFGREDYSLIPRNCDREGHMCVEF